MSNGTAKKKNTALEAYRNRMNAYAKGMKELVEKSRDSGRDTRKERSHDV